MLQKMVRCTSLVSTLPEAALSPQHIRARTCLSRAGGGRALQLAMVSPTGHRMEAGDMVNPLGMCPGLGNRFPLSSWFSEQACGSWKRRDQIRPREKERKKEKKKYGKQEHSWRLSSLSPSNLLRGGGGERQNKRHKKMSQSSITTRASRSKASSVVMQQGRPLPKSPSAFGGAGGPAANAALLWPIEEGHGAGACPTKGKRLPLRLCNENTHRQALKGQVKYCCGALTPILDFF